MALRTTVVGSWWTGGEYFTDNFMDHMQRVLRGIASCFEGVTRGVQICNGTFKGRPLSPIVRNVPWVPIFQRLEGVVDAAGSRDRAADWARVVGEERLWISPSWRFGRHPARSRPVLREKVEHMIEAAAPF